MQMKSVRVRACAAHKADLAGITGINSGLAWNLLYADGNKIRSQTDRCFVSTSSARGIQMFRIDRANFLVTLLVSSLFNIGTAAAQSDDLIWAFSTPNGADGQMSARLDRHVPETDNVQATASCGPLGPDSASSFVVSADIGDLKNGGQTRLRFSGGGNEYEFPARALAPGSEEALRGVEVVIPNTHVLGNVMTSLDALTYQVPGYASQVLPLAGGHESIRRYVTMCRTLASRSQPATVAATKPTAVKDAFAAARELDTLAGYNALINAYPTGFYADLARAHIEKMERRNAAAAPRRAPPAAPPPRATAAPLETYTVGPDRSSWFNGSFDGPDGVRYGAAVQTAGLELITYCTSSRAVGMFVREARAGQYPRFGDRIRQSTQRDGTASLTVRGEGSFRAIFRNESDRRLSLSYPVAVSNGIVKSIMAGQTLVLSRPPFAAIFQLNGSRAAMCRMLDACGVETPECGSRTSPVRDVREAPEPEPRCRSRSVYVEGRGCILKQYANPARPNSVRGCPRGQIRVEGQCMTRRAAIGFCGPGYRVSRGRCVHQNELQQNNAGPGMLKRNVGGFISVAACRRKGMVPEFGYCVEND